MRGLLSIFVLASLIAVFTVPASSLAGAGVRTTNTPKAPAATRIGKVNQVGSSVWTLGHIGPVWMSSPVVATIDGVKAVVQATLSGEIYVVNAKTGRELPGWPQWVHINSRTPTGVDSSPAVAYLDGPDSPPSIIVGAGSMWRRNQQGGLEAFYASGKVRFVFQTERTFNPWDGGPDDYSDPVFATPAVGDITGTGQLDIVFGSYDHNIYALKPNGRLVAGFPIERADTIWSSPTLADVSHTGRDDIIMGGDSSGFDGCRGGWIVDYRYGVAGPHRVAAVHRPDDLVEPDGRDPQQHRATRCRRRNQLEHDVCGQSGHRQDPRGLRRQRSERPGLAGQGGRADVRLAGHRANRRSPSRRGDVLCPLHERPGDCQRLDRLRYQDLVEGIRRPPRGHDVPGSR